MNYCSVLTTQSRKAKALFLAIFLLFSSLLVTKAIYAEGADLPLERVVAEMAELERQKQTAKLSALVELQFALRHTIAEVEANEGSETLFKKIDKNLIKVDQEGVGTAKPTFIGNHIAYVVRPADSEMTYIFVDKKNVQETSVEYIKKHLYKKYIPRQHMFAGSEREDMINGRDVVVAWMDDGSVDLEMHPKQKSYSAKWWQEYFRAVAKAPTKGDYVLGAVAGTMQFGLGMAAAQVKQHFDPGAEFYWDVAFMNLIWGGTIGTFHRTYTNFVYPFARNNSRNQFRSALKASIASYSFMFVLMARTQGFGSFNPLDTSREGAKVAFNFLNVSALGEILRVGSIPILSNYAKNAIKGVVRVREEARLNTNDYNLSEMFAGKKQTGKSKKGDVLINRKGVEYQILTEAPVNLLKNVDYLGVNSGAFPVSKMILVGSILPFRYVTYKVANSIDKKFGTNYVENLNYKNPFESLKKENIKQTAIEIPKKIMTKTSSIMAGILTETYKWTLTPGTQIKAIKAKRVERKKLVETDRIQVASQMSTMPKTLSFSACNAALK